MGSLSRLVGKPPFEPSLIKNVLPLTTAAYGPNSAISLTQTFNRILFLACNGRDFGVQKGKNGDRGPIVFNATLRLPYVCVCVCVFFPFILDIKFVGRTSRGHTGGRSHRIFNPPSFCGACLDFCREKGLAIPFPRRP